MGCSSYLDAIKDAAGWASCARDRSPRRLPPAQYRLVPMLTMLLGRSDESMFFVPIVSQLVASRTEIHLLCLSDGKRFAWTRLRRLDKC